LKDNWTNIAMFFWRGDKTKASRILGKHSTPELYPQIIDLYIGEIKQKRKPPKSNI
jgi:hypothetical protein